MRTIAWLRGEDLRLSDHVPLCRAAASGEVLPLFVLDPYPFARSRAQQVAHRIKFLREPLVALDGNLRITPDPQSQPGGERFAGGRLRAFLQARQRYLDAASAHLKGA